MEDTQLAADVERLAESLGQLPEPVAEPVLVVVGGLPGSGKSYFCGKLAERLKERVSSDFNCAELWLTEFSPVMGYACGTGTLALAFYSEGKGS